MDALFAYDSDTSYVWEDAEVPFTLTLPYVPLRTGTSLSSSGDDNDVESLCDLQTTSDSEMLESAAATAMPSAQVDHLKLAATTNSNCSNFDDDNDVELSIDLETSSDLEVIESSAATAVPLTEVGSKSELLTVQVHETPQ